MPLSSGTKLGPYEIVSPAGAGKRFLINSTVRQTNRISLTLVLNWAAGLKK